MEKFALIGGCNYSGSWQTYQNVQDARKFCKLLVAQYGFKPKNIHTLYQADYTQQNILKELKWLATSGGKTLVIYLTGHGTQVRDVDGDEADGRDEAIQTFDRRVVVDDQVAAILRESAKESVVVGIFDSCHSGTMMDLDSRPCPDRKWICFSSTRSSDSALQSGDGSVFSCQLLDVLRGNPKTYGKLAAAVKKKMKESFVGELQLPVIQVSNPDVWELSVL